MRHAGLAAAMQPDPSNFRICRGFLLLTQFVQPVCHGGNAIAAPRRPARTIIMTHKESTGFCKSCNRQVLIRKEVPNNTFHLLMCVFTCMLWAFVWIIANFFNMFEKSRCTICGSLIDEHAAVHRGKATVFVPAIPTYTPAPTLIGCPVCNAQVSSHAAACLSCGHPIGVTR